MTTLHKLENDLLRVGLSNIGCLTSIENHQASERYAIVRDRLAITTGNGVFCNESSTLAGVEQTAEGYVFHFRFGNVMELSLEYRLASKCGYIRRWISIRAMAEAVTLLNIELGGTLFETPPAEFVKYDTFWHAPTVSFMRWDNGGLFAGIENPFFESDEHDGEVTFSFEPGMVLKPGEAYVSEAQFIGVYKKSGQMISDLPPKTYLNENGKNRGRFRNPSGHIPIDLSEIAAMRAFAYDYLEPETDEFLFILYCYWFPLPQLPTTQEDEERYYKVIDNFHSLGGDLIMFTPLCRSTLPTASVDSYWDIAPEGSAARRILDYTKSKGIKYGLYSGVAARNAVYSNSPVLPYFGHERAEWKKIRPDGSIAWENCLASDDYLDWWCQVQKNTISRFGLSMWNWDPGPGHGLYCYSNNHCHVPGKGEYKGWRNSVEVIRRLKQEFPGLYLQAFYGRKEYGLWGLKYFDQHESYWEQQVVAAASIHPELHSDRMNADGVRLQNWWNENFRFLPTATNHALVHRITQHCLENPDVNKVWDHFGWKYAVMSALATGGSITACILPDDLDAVHGGDFRAFYQKWLAWARDNFSYVKHNISFGDQVITGGVDGYARINDKHGFVFLCNPGPRPTKTKLRMDCRIGLTENGTFTLKQIYPADGYYIEDEATGANTFSHEDELTVTVPAYEVLLLELDEWREDSAAAMLNREASTGSTLTRTLDSWHTPDGRRFSFPYHDACDTLTLDSHFYLGEKVRHLLEEARPENSEETARLIQQWKEADFPDTFAWAKPDRLILVIPFADADCVAEVQMILNGSEIAPECYQCYDTRIIYYADITDTVHWTKENSIQLRLKNVQQNQFLGPYLDYPPIPGAQSSEVVYDRPVQACNQTEAQDSKGAPRPIVVSAWMEPRCIREHEQVTFNATLNLPVEQIRGVYISTLVGAGFFADEALKPNPSTGIWSLSTKVGVRIACIIDSGVSFVWAVAKNGEVSESYKLRMEWHLP